MSTLTLSQSIAREPLKRSASTRSLVVNIVETERKIQKNIETDCAHELIRGRAAESPRVARRSPPSSPRVVTKRSVSRGEIVRQRVSVTAS